MTAQLEIFRPRKARSILAESTSRESLYAVQTIDTMINALQHKIDTEES